MKPEPGVVTLQAELAAVRSRLDLALKRAANLRRAITSAFARLPFDVDVAIAGVDEVLDIEARHSQPISIPGTSRHGAQGDPAPGSV